MYKYFLHFFFSSFSYSHIHHNRHFFIIIITKPWSLILFALNNIFFTLFLCYYIHYIYLFIRCVCVRYYCYDMSFFFVFFTCLTAWWLCYALHRKKTEKHLTQRDNNNNIKKKIGACWNCYCIFVFVARSNKYTIFSSLFFYRWW